MKKYLLLSAFLVIAPALVQAQEKSIQFRGDGYLFIGEGVLSVDGAHYGMSHVGGGGEVALFKGFGVGSELGAMGKPGEGTGLFSINPFYRFLYAGAKSKIVPFVTGGYTRPFGNRGFTFSNNLVNFGGGIDYWAFKRVGVRLEFRDYVDHSHFMTSTYPAIRIGIVFR